MAIAALRAGSDAAFDKTGDLGQRAQFLRRFGRRLRRAQDVDVRPGVDGEVTGEPGTPPLADGVDDRDGARGPVEQARARGQHDGMHRERVGFGELAQRLKVPHQNGAAHHGQVVFHPGDPRAIQRAAVREVVAFGRADGFFAVCDDSDHVVQRPMLGRRNRLREGLGVVAAGVPFDETGRDRARGGARAAAGQAAQFAFRQIEAERPGGGARERGKARGRRGDACAHGEVVARDDAC